MKKNLRLAQLLDRAAVVLATESRDSDAYLIDSVLPAIPDNKFASVIGLAGFVLLRTMTVDAKNQTVEALLSHQEKGTDMALTIQGSYVRPRDGEWLVRLNQVSGEGKKLQVHGPFEWDVKKDATSLMKAVVSLLKKSANA